MVFLYLSILASYDRVMRVITDRFLARYVAVFFALSSLHGIIHEKEIRTFTSSDGKEIVASLDHYNTMSNEVTIRTENGQKYDLPLERFAEADQAYILEWRDDYDASFVKVDFFTNRIDGGRIVFMLDSSGSMKGERWDKMVRNMVTIIRRMDKGADFNIILFGSEADLFKPDLIEANEDGKLEAEKWLTSRYPEGGTNLLAAIQAAAPMKKAAVYAILSDGYPSGKASDIADKIKANSKKNDLDIKVYGVSYESSSKGQEFLKGLSKAFNGRYVRR